ncbi:hypothetical protein MYU51_006429 [Penicillium brevicompactum]
MPPPNNKKKKRPSKKWCHHCKMGGHSDAECYRQVGKKESPAGKKGPMETPARKKGNKESPVSKKGNKRVRSLDTTPLPAPSPDRKQRELTLPPSPIPPTSKLGAKRAQGPIIQFGDPVAPEEPSRPPLAPSTGVSSAVRDGDLSSGELVFIAAWLVSYRRTGSVALAAGAALDHWAESSVLHSRAPRVEDESTQDGGAAEEEKKKEEEEEDEWEDIDE